MSKSYRKLSGFVVIAAALAQCLFAANAWSTSLTPGAWSGTNGDVGTITGTIVSSTEISGTYNITDNSLGMSYRGSGTWRAINTYAAPSAPVMTITTSGLSVTVSWNAVAGATGYTLYYAPYPSATPIRSMDMGTRTSLSVTLSAGAAYYIAVKANNAAGSSNYSNVEHFTATTGALQVTDIDGNVYNTVTIGTQTWMRENLKVTKYRDGTAIGSAWAYNNDSNNTATYGRLYTWYDATDIRGLCPSGWHLPTDTEWTTLTEYLGGSSVAGGKMREAGTTHWTNPNTGADNSSGFTALPGGYRAADGYGGGTFRSIGSFSYWWSATIYGTAGAWNRFLYYYYDGAARDYGHSKLDGFSVRCARD